MVMKSIEAPLRRASKKNPVPVGDVFTGYIRPRLEDCPKITSSRDAYNFLMKDWDDHLYVESFKILFLNRANFVVKTRIIGVSTISKGGVSGTVADPKVIYQKALACHASGIILAHNHPSGNNSPSQADIDLTKKLREAAKLFDMLVLDHIIVTGQGKYYSFADEGLM